jgi:hypothetical protein
MTIPWQANKHRMSNIAEPVPSKKNGARTFALKVYKIAHARVNAEGEGYQTELLNRRISSSNGRGQYLKIQLSQYILKGK